MTAKEAVELITRFAAVEVQLTKQVNFSRRGATKTAIETEKRLAKRLLKELAPEADESDLAKLLEGLK